LEEIVGVSLDVLNKRVTVKGLPLQGSENHHLQSAGEEVSLLGVFHGALRNVQ
jgi:hypothetical protein